MNNISLSHRLEYAAMRILGFFLYYAPYRLALSIGWVLAWIWHHIVKYRRAAVYDRLRSVFPDADEKRIRRIAWLAWRDMVFNGVEMFRLPKINMKWIRKHVLDWEKTKREVESFCSPGKGVVIASIHMGAPEVAAVVMQHFGAPIFVITARQKNILTSRRLDEMRSATGVATVQAGSTVIKSVIQRLRKGEILAFMSDIRVRKGGITVDFLGSKASVAPGMARFVRQEDAPLIPLVIRREGWTKHRLTFFPELHVDDTLPKKEDLQRLTGEVMSIHSKAILETPEQWFWYNKNWILDPVPEDHQG